MFKPIPQPRTKTGEDASMGITTSMFTDLPVIPNDLPEVPQANQNVDNSDDIDFDDLTKRFDALKKKK